MPERRFDHAEAYELRFRDRIPVETLAVKFGVTEVAIRRATEEGYRRLHRACSARYYAKRTRAKRMAKLQAQIERRNSVG